MKNNRKASKFINDPCTTGVILDQILTLTVYKININFDEKNVEGYRFDYK